MASIELVKYPLVGGAANHLAWLKKDDQGNEVDNFHGFASRQGDNGNWQTQRIGDSSDKLRFYQNADMKGQPELIQSYPGTQDQIDATWQKGIAAGQQINENAPSYIMNDPGYTTTTLSQLKPQPPAMNSNSVARTLGDAMGLPLPKDEDFSGYTPGWNNPIQPASPPAPGPRSDAAPPDPSTYFSGMFGDSPIMVAPMAQVMYGAGGGSGITSLLGQPDGSGAGFDSTAQLSGSNGGSPDVGAVNDNTLTNDNSLSSDTLSAGDWAQALA